MFDEYDPEAAGDADGKSLQERVRRIYHNVHVNRIPLRRGMDDDESLRLRAELGSALHDDRLPD